MDEVGKGGEEAGRQAFSNGVGILDLDGQDRDMAGHGQAEGFAQLDALAESEAVGQGAGQAGKFVNLHPLEGAGRASAGDDGVDEDGLFEAAEVIEQGEAATVVFANLHSYGQSGVIVEHPGEDESDGIVAEDVVAEAEHEERRGEVHDCRISRSSWRWWS